MNKQEIEKAISNINYGLHYENCGNMVMITKFSAHMAISALTQQLNNGWIPVDSNGLPNKSGYYLVTALGGFKEKKPFIEYAYYDEGMSCIWFMIADGKEEEHKQWKEELKNVIAWQPLPEPMEVSDAERN